MASKSLYQAPALVKSIEYSKPLSYGPIAKTVIAAEPAYAKTVIAAEPTYAKTIVSEPIYTKNVYAEPIYPAKTLIAEPVYGKSILAQPAPIYGGKVVSYGSNYAYGGYGAHGW
uniref:Uncharacterized protein n=1 Tax=Anopheles epiroticus TaxID=199890 RepID=A0A182PVJ4_9DIPT